MTLRSALSTCLWLALAAGASAGVIGGTDVRIGAADNRTGARASVVDYHPTTGNYFAVVAWNDRLTFNISTDAGASFTRRYRLISCQGLRAFDMAVSKTSGCGF